jgi:membrane-associated protein
MGRQREQNVNSVLFAAGFLAAQPHFGLNIWLLASGAFVLAVVGDSVGYSIGRHVGRRLFQRDDSFLFHRKHLLKATPFYERHGGQAIILARFLPVMRLLAPVVAGMGAMRYPRFIAYNVIGGVLWGAGLPLAGYLFGAALPAEQVDRYLLPVIFLIIIVALTPGAIHVVTQGRRRGTRMVT